MKKTTTLFFAFLFLFLNGKLSYAQKIDAIEAGPTINRENRQNIEYPMAEKAKWFYKKTDGGLYKRLWSIERQKWLTNWIKVS